MKYVRYELQKVVGIRYIHIFLAVCLLLNAGFSIYQTRYAQTTLPPVVAETFFSAYATEKDRMDAAYAERRQWEEEQNALSQEQIRLGNYDFEKAPYPDKYAPEGYSDTQLFSELFHRLERIKSYPSTIQNTLSRASTNLTELETMGIGPDSYAVKYQKQVLELYGHAKQQVRMGLEYTRGWDAYFLYEYVNIFIFLVLLMTGAVIFTQEKSHGTLALIVASKNGRWKTALAKIIAAMVITTVIVCIFSLETFVLFAVRIGFSSLYNAIQIYSCFTMCPYVITVGEYLLLRFGIRLLVFYAFSGTVMALSIFLGDSITTFVAGLGVFGLNFFVYTFSLFDKGNPIRCLNFIAGAAVYPLFTRYRAVNILGEPVGFISVLCTIASLLLLVLSSVSIWHWNRTPDTPKGATVSLQKFLKKQRHFLPSLHGKRADRGKKKQKMHVYPLSLTFTEVYKAFVASRFWMVMVFLFLLKIGLSGMEYRAPQSYADLIYKEYMTTLAGEMTGEKRQYCIDERNRIQEILAQKDPMQQKYLRQELSAEEYYKYLKEYNHAYSRKEEFGVIEKHAAYIERLEAGEPPGENKREAWFVYDSGWKKIFFSPFDWTLYAALLILGAGIFSVEYRGTSSSGNFSQILRLTKFGRKKTFAGKFMTGILSSVLITLVWNAVDFWFIAQAYELPLFNAPVSSMELFENIAWNITLLQYLILLYSVRCLASLLLSGFLAALSAIFQKSIAVLLAATMFTLLPMFVSRLGWTAWKAVDYTRWMRASPIFMQNTETIVFPLLCAVICTAAVLVAARKWNR